MSAEPITMGWIRAHAGTKFLGHIAMQDCHQLSRAIVDKRDGQPIGIFTTSISYKRNKRNGEKAGTTEQIWFVEGHDGEIATLEEALEVLRIEQLGQEVA